jgi:hypothetical protein
MTSPLMYSQLAADRHRELLKEATAARRAAEARRRRAGAERRRTVRPRPNWRPARAEVGR